MRSYWVDKEGRLGMSSVNFWGVFSFLVPQIAVRPADGTRVLVNLLSDRQVYSGPLVRANEDGWYVMLGEKQ